MERWNVFHSSPNSRRMKSGNFGISWAWEMLPSSSFPNSLSRRDPHRIKHRKKYLAKGNPRSRDVSHTKDNMTCPLSLHTSSFASTNTCNCANICWSNQTALAKQRSMCGNFCQNCALSRHNTTALYSLHKECHTCKHCMTPVNCSCLAWTRCAKYEC